MTRRAYFVAEHALRRVPIPSLRRRCQNWLTRRAVAEYQKRVVRRHYSGVELTVELSDPVSEAWYENGWGRLRELDLLETSRLKAGARVFDLGAHQGVLALRLAASVGPSGSVMALEPEAHNVRSAIRNCELNGARNVRVVRGAVARESGQIEFDGWLNGHVESRSERCLRNPVEAWAIDDMAKRFGPPDVVYLDVEGYEAQALEGAAATLAQTPDWQVEVHVSQGLERYGKTAWDVLRFFHGFPYRLYVHTDAAPEPRPYSEKAMPRERFFLTALGTPA